MANADAKVNPAHAKLAPADEFRHPDDVLASEKLSFAEKKKVLDQWETDAKALARAADEGMVEGEPSRLLEVQRAKRGLKRLARNSAAAARH